MDKVSEIKQGKSKTTPSSHRDFFAKLYGSLEEEYNKKRGLDSNSSSSSGNAIVNDANNINLTNEKNVKYDHSTYDDTIDDESEYDKDKEYSPLFRPMQTLKSKYLLSMIYFFYEIHPRLKGEKSIVWTFTNLKI